MAVLDGSAQVVRLRLADTQQEEASGSGHGVMDTKSRDDGSLQACIEISML